MYFPISLKYACDNPVCEGVAPCWAVGFQLQQALRLLLSVQGPRLLEPLKCQRTTFSKHTGLIMCPAQPWVLTAEEMQPGRSKKPACQCQPAGGRPGVTHSPGPEQEGGVLGKSACHSETQRTLGLQFYVRQGDKLLQ